MKDIIEPGDVAEALRADAAIADDTLQRRSGREVVRPKHLRRLTRRLDAYAVR